MRFAILLVCVFSSSAVADGKTKELAKGYEKEASACRTRADGVAKVTTGTQGLVDAGQKQYDADLATLRGGLAQVQAYCAELAATLEILNADPAASYKSLERKLDEQDNKIRKLRQSSKKALDDLAPVITRMIPIINAARAEAAPTPPKKTHVKFPSGRTIDVLAFAGTYKVSGSDATDTLEYTEDKAGATLTVRLVANATCDAQRGTISKGAIEVTPTDTTKPLGLAWYVAYAKDARRVRVACRTAKGGAVVATLDEPSAVAKWPELEPVLAAMIAAR
jgi:hypothetical protein